ncbi:nitrous oxide reductase accessory protein NosL [Rhodohalobacter sp. 8-1]|uniref:nitrous oxide reductase accessory protein NosL n=1 Tax=Rhodohalobacter sp. 8-1 TaxID=3131972 RepID=UPI0030ED815C
MKKYLVISTLVLFLFSACFNQEPKEINLHTDECTYCKMVVSDRQFASQLVSDKGKSYPFDSIECMAAYAYQTPDLADKAKLYVADFTQPVQWLLLDNADIYRAESVQSPMGLSLFALPGQETMPPEIADAEQMGWDEIINFVVEQWDVKQ